MSNLTYSEARKGEVVTTVSRFSGYGIGYLIDGQVWITVGSYWAVKAEDDTFSGIVMYHRDNGEGYSARVKAMLG